MDRFGKVVLFTLGLCGLVIAVSLIPATSVGAAGGPEVTILNTPLPIQGTVAVSNLSTNQTISGTVAVSNFPSTQQVSGNLSVSNTTDGNGNPVPLVVQSAQNGSTVFDAGGLCNFANGVPGICIGSINYTIPAGKIGVVQYASGACEIQSGTNLSTIEFKLSPSKGFVSAFFGPRPSMDAGNQKVVSSFGQNLTLYLPENTQPAFSIESNADDTGQQCQFEIDGYLINK